ncbi:hypothetical protein GGX14DRAFT_406384 [Mycena pura]|uniref:Uncharacterized protein n=1 Tax=Mycena pura TaxID=153505 RepID=A0AAD6UQH1_9AGAR|nr:hypothetical protein GGX14DRAFT_406384 [Mycena pura]
MRVEGRRRVAHGCWQKRNGPIRRRKLTGAVVRGPEMARADFQLKRGTPPSKPALPRFVDSVQYDSSVGKVRFGNSQLRSKSAPDAAAINGPGIGWHHSDKSYYLKYSRPRRLPRLPPNHAPPCAFLSTCTPRSSVETAGTPVRYFAREGHMSAVRAAIQHARHLSYLFTLQTNLNSRLRHGYSLICVLFAHPWILGKERDRYKVATTHLDS